MRKAVAVSLLVLGSILLGSLAAGTGQVGDDSPATVTAGIHLTTAPGHHRTSVIQRVLPRIPRFAALQSLLVLVQVLLAAATLAVALARPPGDPRSLLRRHSTARRGPPILA
jgi:hypothetical protein